MTTQSRAACTLFHTGKHYLGTHAWQSPNSCLIATQANGALLPATRTPYTCGKAPTNSLRLVKLSRTGALLEPREKRWACY